MSQWIHSDQAPNFPLPFSQALRAGDFVYVSGQVGVDPETRQVVGSTIETQTLQSLRNIETILAAAGLTLDHVVKVNAYLSRLEDFPGYNKVYESVMKRPFPARTSVQSGIGDYLVEIDVVAYVHTVRGETKG
ncbi:reactive intermediate/imine deaminase [Paenibacillus sp. UNCCL117]|uniref:RidA family protein n=1 Tax=unclassified Paenibacillus TaxID=185978 RepID=UPI00087F12D8|nr:MULTISPECIES: RidA family protein [unclassified Paenibacillus]SDD62826.1 reactive intermediate/imine deaminase [Paenibacillus sp. cl123]SFW67698.1 reactive intermediate/imine deaminase [Paenibacillus sp. UNCCL117]